MPAVPLEKIEHFHALWERMKAARPDGITTNPEKLEELAEELEADPGEVISLAMMNLNARVVENTTLDACFDTWFQRAEAQKAEESADGTE